MQKVAVQHVATPSWLNWSLVAALPVGLGAYYLCLRRILLAGQKAGVEKRIRESLEEDD